MAGTVPKWITQIKRADKRKRWADWYKRPWTVPTNPDKARAFKAALWKHGLVTPHYTKAEAKSKDGRGVPDSLRRGCQKQGFLLERARHMQGDKPLRILSWYRSPQHNAAVGGATSSKHMKATACDPQDTIRVDVARRVWANGGIGYQGYVGGTIRHVDTGPKRAWVY
jgi:hypothetical protein